MFDPENECVMHGVSWTLIFGGAKQERSQNFGSRGEHQKKFIHEFLSRFVLQWHRQNFSSGKPFSKNVLIKNF